MQYVEASEYSVRSAVWTLRRGQTPLCFVLFPMVHLGSQEFYDEVARRAARCDVIVAEGHGGEPPPRRRMFVALNRRARRLHGEGLVYQNIDYAATGRPVLWPDEEPSPVRRPLRHRLLFAGLVLALPFVMAYFLLRGGAWFLQGQSGLNVEDTSYDDGLGDGTLDTMVLRDRDRKLIAVLERLHEERQEEPLSVAVVYGAAHMPGVVRHFTGAHGYRPGSAEWLTVFGARYERRRDVRVSE
ncbi:hypothetical protein AB0M28_21190 [Streptomyces sp. NPDC051940]|uniref:hypothetical protein n=1 Tax=Streptomyces sp. NPDC051940 TaxID=3155675 RepID=UPI00344382A8